MARSREFNKEDVLDQAIQLFSVRGYEATSIRDVIDLTGISSSSLYEVFGDKRGIFLAALERSCRFERERISQMAVEASTPQVFIEQLFAALEDVAIPDVGTQRSLAFNTMVEFGTLDPPVTVLLLEHYFGIAEIIAHLLSEAQTRGSITTQENPRDLAYTILNTLQGFATIKGIQPSFGYGATITRLMLKLLN
jgi:TetR/AcrR family transcriptional regulator, transcriptional repressor for nem operon